MKKLIVFICAILFILTSLSATAVVCPHFENISANFPNGASSQSFAAFTRLNDQNVDHFWFRDLGDARLTQYWQWNSTANTYTRNSSRDFQSSLPQGSDKTSMACGYNLSGMNATECLFQRGGVQSFMNFWNGSNMTNNTNYDSHPLTGQGNDNDDRMAAAPEFLAPGRSVIWFSNSSNGLGSYDFQNNTFTRNDSYSIGIPDGDVANGFTIVKNMTGTARWNLVYSPPGLGSLSIFDWSGTQWVNSSAQHIPYLFAQAGNLPDIGFVFNATYSRGNWSLLKMDSGAADKIMSGFANNSFLQSSSVINNGTLTVGNSINFTAAYVSACGTQNISLELNFSTGNRNITAQSTTSTATSGNFSQNYTLSTGCGNDIGGKVYIQDRNTNFLNFTFALSKMLPAIYNSSANAGQRIVISCASVNNVSVESNATATLDFVVNMSALTQSGNRTCNYGANNISRIENRNSSRGCDIFVYGASLTSSLNITISASQALSQTGVPNLPIAIAAGAIGTLIVVYTINRTRRSS